MMNRAQVKESGITQIALCPARWLAFYTIECPRAGYDIPPTEDYWKTFDTEQEAIGWLKEHIGD